MKIKLTLLLVFCFSLLLAIDIPENNYAVPISVSLTGFVENPNVYQLSPINRLSDLLALEQKLSLEAKLVLQPTVPLPVSPIQANSPSQMDKEQESTPDYKKLQALRTIKITRDGKSFICDLQRFYRLGDSTQNPYLKDGDVVVVSAINSFVTVSGGVNLAGEVEFVAGDKLSDVLDLVKGFKYDADKSKISIYRYQINQVDFEVTKLDLQNNPAVADFPLQANDQIVVLQDSEISNKQKVKLSGMVKNPGEYLIEKNTTLFEVIQLAGGFTSRADAHNLVYYSENVNLEPNPYLDLLMQRSMSDMTPLEYSYLRTNMLQLNGKYSIDAKKLVDSEGKESNPILHNGDRIYIPELMDVVWVSGQVKHPGLVPWVEGKDWDYYIKSAGGYANNRKHGKGRLIRGRSGNWVKPKNNLAIMPGDTVFVPGQIDRSLWSDVKDIVTLSSSVITIIIGLNALTKKN
ncbi:MAG: SLBB domain-containing protein [Candidatus Cloacimonetes bacterium]|nr:SLBB domain-containing protein [Candidatus Cloacimonadota bacterium]